VATGTIIANEGRFRSGTASIGGFTNVRSAVLEGQLHGLAGRTVSGIIATNDVQNLASGAESIMQYFGGFIGVESGRVIELTSLDDGALIGGGPGSERSGNSKLQLSYTAVLLAETLQHHERYRHPPAYTGQHVLCRLHA